MHIHILGIAGKLMSGLAVMAHQLGYEVSGSDANLHSPMAKQLRELNITLFEGYEPSHLSKKPDLVVVGNVMSRGNPIIEAMLNQNIDYSSAPEWLAKHVLKDKWVIGISGTHGKTTTASMIAWILEYNGFNPSFLIGGQPNNFTQSSRLNLGSPFFVIESDEYDSAFFDKRPKFIHYHPNTLVINNLEFDHADIYDSLEEIQKQFHYLVRTVPGQGLIICPKNEPNLQPVFDQGLWTPLQTVGDQGDWSIKNATNDFSAFDVLLQNEFCGHLKWSLLGEHNANNALVAIAAAHHAGIQKQLAVEALSQFKGVERRLQPLGNLQGATVFDDFAHHPTAIKTTLTGVRSNVGPHRRIVVILEFGSYTMKHGVHLSDLSNSLENADFVFLLNHNCDWNIQSITDSLPMGYEVHDHLNDLGQALAKQIQRGDQVIIMSNQDSTSISKAIGL